MAENDKEFLARLKKRAPKKSPEEELDETDFSGLEEKEKGKGEGFLEEPEPFGGFELPEGESFGPEEGEEKESEGEEARPSRLREFSLADWEEPLEYEKEVYRPVKAREFGGESLAFLDFLPKISLRAHSGKIFAAFAAIYLVFSAAMVYLLFFNSGLALGTESTSGLNKLFLENRSGHEINGITVWLTGDASGEREKLMEITSLLPGEKQVIEAGLLPAKPFVDLEITARFHQKLTGKISLGQAVKTASFSTSFTVPRTVFVGTAFEAKTRICNEGGEEIEVIVTESHEASEFAEKFAAKKLSLQAKKCGETVYSFTPLKAGNSTIYFNMVSGDNSEKQPIDLEVIG